MINKTLSITSQIVKPNLANKIAKLEHKIKYPRIIFDSSQDFVSLSLEEIHKGDDRLWHLTKSKDKNRAQFRKNVNYMTKKFLNFRNKIETQFRIINDNIEKDLNKKSCYFNCFLFKLINQLLNINSNFSKSSYMPSISEQYIVDKIQTITETLAELRNGKYLDDKPDLRKNYNDLSAIIDEFNLSEFEKMAEFNVQYKLNKIDKKIALINLNKNNPNYIKLKYANKNVIDHTYYYNKKGNLRIKYESAEDEINQLRQNQYRIENNRFQRTRIPSFFTNEKHLKFDNTRYGTLIVKNGKKIGKTFVSPKTLNKLFNGDFPIQTIGDCYVVNVLNQMLLNDKSRIKLYNCFQEVRSKDGSKYIKVKFPQLKYYLLYKVYSNEPLFKNNSGSLKGSSGFKMLEEVYCVNRIIERLDRMEKSDLIPNEIKQLVKLHKSTITKQLFSTSLSLDDRIQKLVNSNKEISMVLSYTNKKIKEMNSQYLEQLHDKNFISDNDYTKFKEGVGLNKLADIIIFLTPFLEKNDSELPKFKNKTEKEEYYKNYVSSIRSTDFIPYNQLLLALFDLEINGLHSVEGGQPGEVAKAFGYTTEIKIMNRLTQKKYSEIMLNALNHDPSYVQPEGGFISHHAQSVIGTQKYGLYAQEPNSSNIEQVVLFDYYPRLFNSEQGEFVAIENYS